MTNLCWIRRDLRTKDHHALSQALKDGPTIVFFNFDPNILKSLPADDRRVTFIIESLKDLEHFLQKYHSSIYITFGEPEIEILNTVKKFNIKKVYFNRDYEPKAQARDEKVTKILKNNEIEVFHFKDHVFFEKHEVLNEKKEIYKVFTPYKNKWIYHLESNDSEIPNYQSNFKNLYQYQNPNSILNTDWFKIIQFTPTENVIKGGETEALKKLLEFKKYLAEYKLGRDFPSLEKTSGLSPYIRMGNISVREMIRFSRTEKNEGADTFLSEIIWREFYQMILSVYPKVESKCFKADYDQLQWENNPEYFNAWKLGMTGYPIVDAAMRCLNETGLMHNRLRMVVASFLTKTLLCDWRLGERYFAEKLLDFDLAANNGGWQWSASTGVDAQPYFRIFNPYNQSEKFDEDGLFIKMWCPELKDFDRKLIHFPHEADLAFQAKCHCIIGVDYPHPIVSYRVQKEKALKMFQKIKAM